MNTLLLPVAGASSRFPGMRPKWLLTMPNGNLMYEESIKGINLKHFSRVIVTCLQEHLDKYADYDLVLKSAKKNIHKDVEILVLKNQTSSHAETIYETLIKKKVSGKFFIKDCDNFFNLEYVSGNNISVLSLNNIVTSGILWSTAVAISCTLNINPPSPVTATTFLSGFATWAPKPVGNA